jgi:hypothetical protein
VASCGLSKPDNNPFTTSDSVSEPQSAAAADVLPGDCLLLLLLVLQSALLLVV